MFCPKCKAEYRQGATRCSDCDVKLIDHLPESNRDSHGDLADANLRGIWAGEDQNECVSICAQLRDAEIPFKVHQHRRQFFKGMDEKYEIGVPPKFCDQAKKIIDQDRLDFSDEESDQKIMELPAEDGVADSKRIDKGRDPDTCDAEDATVEVKFPRTSEHVMMIESSLRENHIYYRSEILDDGSQKIFVAPKDELRAREIVHEIEDGTPPN